MKHSFKNSLAKGKAGEALILELWPDLTVIEGGRRGDFTVKLKAEVKSDSYGLNGSPNFFIERWSDVDKQKPGGPWQAAAHDCSLFIYFYPTDRVAFIFDTIVLINMLTPLLTELAPVKISNKSWTTVGYKVPREALKGFYTIKDFKEIGL